VIGGVLIVTAGDDAEPVPLDDVVTTEGLATRVPEGWTEGEQPLTWVSPGGSVFDTWTVRRACPLDGCTELSLEAWRSLARDLPTFTAAREEADVGLFGIEEGFEGGGSGGAAYVMRASTRTGADVVFVAAFRDGADFYVACNAQLDLGNDDRLVDEIVDVCLDTRESQGAINPES
jgi:hypothetical protein